jgi:hypothetical protein
MRIYGMQIANGREEYLVLCSCGERLTLPLGDYCFYCPKCNLHSCIKFLASAETERGRGSLGKPGRPSTVIWDDPDFCEGQN